eukprot:g81347.t1
MVLILEQNYPPRKNVGDSVRSRVALSSVTLISGRTRFTELTESDRNCGWAAQNRAFANLDVKDKLIMSGFRFTKKNLIYACNVALKEVANILIFSRVLLRKPIHFVELQEFMNNYCVQLPGWKWLGQRQPDLLRVSALVVAAALSLLRMSSRCSLAAAGELQWQAGTQLQCTGMLTLRIMGTSVIWRELNFCAQESKIITCGCAIHYLPNHP